MCYTHKTPKFYYCSSHWRSQFIHFYWEVLIHPQKTWFCFFCFFFPKITWNLQPRALDSHSLEFKTQVCDWLVCIAWRDPVRSLRFFIHMWSEYVKDVTTSHKRLLSGLEVIPPSQSLPEQVLKNGRFLLLPKCLNIIYTVADITVFIKQNLNQKIRIYTSYCHLGLKIWGAHIRTTHLYPIS